MNIYLITSSYNKRPSGVFKKKMLIECTVLFYKLKVNKTNKEKNILQSCKHVKVNFADFNRHSFGQEIPLLKSYELAYIRYNIGTYHM